jgi:4-hydroxybenzoate polyprenyltransferase
MTRLQNYAQLMRLPNLPSAIADICLGALFTHSLPARWLSFGLLVLASSCLYCAGMVWNDWFDLEQDKRERPDRPLPSGRVALGEAFRLGCGLLAAGVIFAVLAALALPAQPDGTRTFLPVVLAVLLVVAILLYDGSAKRTAAGPVVMGSCRFLNVLLGVSVAGTLAWPQGAHLALVVGLYVAGLTWFARTEARQSNQLELRAAAGVMLASLLLALLLPAHIEEGSCSPLFPYLLLAFGFALGLPVVEAIRVPTPQRVQGAVTRLLIGLIPLDALLASTAAGTAGLALLVLLAPSVYLNRRRWLYAT